MLKMLITGAGGFIGKNLAEFYADKYEVVGCGRPIHNSITTTLTINKPDIIIHCGAEIYDESKMFYSNVDYTIEILDYCKSNKVKKLIILGSSSEYGRKDHPISEEDTLEPQTMYEATKAAVSMLAAGYANTYKIPITIIRPFTVVGRYEKPHKFFPTLYRSAKKNLPIKLSEGVHDFVFVDEFIQDFDLILNYKEEDWFNIVNVGSCEQTSNEEIVALFEKIMNHKYEIQKVDKLRTFDSSKWVSDSTLLVEKYGAKAEGMGTLEEGISKFVQDCERLGLYNERV